MESKAGSFSWLTPEDLPSRSRIFSSAPSFLEDFLCFFLVGQFFSFPGSFLVLGLNKYLE